MNTLEKMGEFLNARLDGYEEHQMTTIKACKTDVCD